MIYGITVEKLTEEQLDALEIINAEVAKVERERRLRESTYEDLESLMPDVMKAYSDLRPMYDNMRNNDTKKTITSSGIIEMLEKLIRTAKKDGIEIINAVEGEVTEADIAPVAYASRDVSVKKEPSEEKLAELNKKSTVEPVTVPVINDWQTNEVVEERVEVTIPRTAPQPISQDKLNEILAGIPVVGKI